MKHPNETAIVYNSIKKDSSLNDEALIKIGVSKERISKALEHCLTKGMSRKASMRTVFNLWKQADKDGQAHPTNKELALMGFIDKDGTWIHTLTGLTLTTEEIKTKSFSEVEGMVFKAAHDNIAKQNASRPPHGDNETK